jgi:hypothetical protein
MVHCWRIGDEWGYWTAVPAPAREYLSLVSPTEALGLEVA